MWLLLVASYTGISKETKYCFAFKNSQNRRFHLWKCAASGYAWKMLSGFWVFFSLLSRSRWLLNRLFLGHSWPPFWPFLSHFWPYRGLYRAILGAFLGTKIGPFRVILRWFCPHFFGSIGVTLGSLRTILASFWQRFGVVLVSFCPHFEGHFFSLFGPFRCCFFFCPLLGRF